MRFLFVYQDHSEQARKLLDDLGVHDVILILARKNSTSPTPEEVERLEANKGADAAACQINRKYRKNASAYVRLCYEPKRFRFEDQQLREWLVPANQSQITYGKPSDAFRAAAARAPMLVLHPSALEFADDLARHRWRFATLGADLLARYALDEELGPAREWKRSHGVEFASNGRVVYSYRGQCGTETRGRRTAWHLKEGDRTTRESSARIYFDRMEFTSGVRVIVMYVGPHPEDGERSISFSIS